MMRSLEGRRFAPMSNLEPLVDCDGVTENAFARHLPATPTVMVKNTFIQSVVQDAQADDSDELPSVVVTRSCPASHSHGEGSWERRVFCKAPLVECNGEDDSEDEIDPEMPMMVVRTCSDFSTLSGGPTVSDDGSSEDHTDYGFADSPTHTVGDGLSFCAEDFLVERSDDGADSISGIGSTFLNRIHGVSVKNTFIDDYLDEEEEPLSSVVATHSCPPPGLDGLKGTFPLEDLVAFHFQLGGRRWTPSPAPRVKVQQPSKPPGIFFQRVGEDAQTRTASPESRQTSSESEAVSETSPESLAAGVAPLERRQPEMSAGSASHDCGECRPCAWFWRAQGCLNGKDCKHCHLCPQGAMKARRKVKKAQANSDPASGTA